MHVCLVPIFAEHWQVVMSSSTLQVAIKSSASLKVDGPQSPGPVATLEFDILAHQPFGAPHASQAHGLLLLWDWYSRQQGWSLSQPVLPLLGSFAWPAKLHPDASMQAGTCSLSHNLIHRPNSLTDPYSLLVFQPQPYVSLGSDVVQQSTKQPSGKTAVYLRLMLDMNTGKPGSSLLVACILCS